MHVFRIVLKDKNSQGGNNYLDLAVTEQTSLTAFGQAIKAQGGVCNEHVAIPYENVLYVARMDVEEITAGIHAPAMGSA